jgi:L-alanine-DL-glutamate epimerase-like enolase superfamily enzyme
MSRIQNIELFPVGYPVQGYFKFFEARPGETPKRPTVVIKITDNEGRVGWGESVPAHTWSDENIESAYATLKRYLAPKLIGHDPLDIEGAHTIMNKAVPGAFSVGQPIAKAGVDIALHDVAGKITGRRVFEMMRPVPDPTGIAPREAITLSWTINATSLADAEASVAEGHRRGYHHFNLKVGPPQTPAYDIELCQLIRRLAPTAFLWPDANCGYDLDTARRLVPKFADSGCAVLESPLPPNFISGYQALRKTGGLPILMDEGICSPRELEEFIRLGMLDGVAMKHARMGGLLRAKQAISLLRDNGLIFMASGLSDPDISLSAALAVFAAFGLDRPAALNGPQYLGATVVRGGLPIQGDQARVPSGPGLGIEVDTAKLRDLALPLGF